MFKSVKLINLLICKSVDIYLMQTASSSNNRNARKPQIHQVRVFKTTEMHENPKYTRFGFLKPPKCMKTPNTPGLGF